MNRITQLLKHILPTSLFGRSLLILVVPTVLIQLVAIYIFYERHWDSIVRNMSASLAGEVAMLVHETHLANESERLYRKELFEEISGMQIFFTSLDRFHPMETPDPRFKDFIYQLDKRLKQDFSVRQLDGNGDIHIEVKLKDTVLVVEVSKKRLVSTTTLIFVIWVIGSSFILLVIAVVFLRNQVRPITHLAAAAEGFGLGQDDPTFRPYGAREVRQAARAFLTMRSRIKRQMETRTTMLSGISHDLRTPLTRMKLQLAMLEDKEAAEALQGDVEEMQHMVEEYIDFIKGEGSEDITEVDVASYLELVLTPYERSGDMVSLQVENSAVVPLRRRAFKRALDNLIGNALRYGRCCTVQVSASEKFVTITVEDKGPGIPEEAFEEVFKPFKRLEASRNTKTGGVGLGLTIAKDIVQAHGGDVSLRNKLDEDGATQGLQAIIRLPLKLQQQA